MFTCLLIDTARRVRGSIYSPEGGDNHKHIQVIVGGCDDMFYRIPSYSLWL